MAETPGRLLTLLSLLQSRPVWTGAELAARLEVTPRTVRRDVDRLRRLGYPVNAVSGPAGGYELGVGGAMPPLLLDDNEAVAVAVGLRAAADGSVTGLEDATMSALAKLDQVLPRHLADRVADVAAATVQLWARDPEGVDPSVLVTAARACRRAERLRFSYTTHAGVASQRVVAPYRLVRSGPRWYLVALDAGAGEWRTFRVDRMAAAACTGERFHLVDPPEPAALVARGTAVAPYPVQATLRIPLPPSRVADLIPRTVGVATPAGEDATLVEMGGGDVPSMVRWLAGLPCAVEVLAPEELREALRRHGAALSAANPPPTPPRGPVRR